MIPENRIPTHPGEILLEEFLRPTGTTRDELSKRMGVPVEYLHEIADGERGITPDVAILLSQALDTSPRLLARFAERPRSGPSRPSYGEARTTRRGRKHRELPGSNRSIDFVEPCTKACRHVLVLERRVHRRLQ